MSNLLLYDIDNFINKYTRYMTKNIYINKHMYERFLEQYAYLYKELEEYKFLYNENPKYKKMMNIKRNKSKLIKLHNQKYLKNTLTKHENFFLTFDKEQKLDKQTKSIIIAEENTMLVIQNKNTNLLTIGKIKYLIQEKKLTPSQILILTEEDNPSLKDELIQNNLSSVRIITTKDYGLSLLKKEQKLLDFKRTYDIISEYLIKYLFPKRIEFDNFYQQFKQNIYLNKDYKDFETFKDYHSYMYKRKYLSSNLSLKKYNEQEIKKRTAHLRTIKNELVNTKEEVDIANFLFLNSIEYQYLKKESCFKITNIKEDTIKFLNEKEKIIIPPDADPNLSPKEQLMLYQSEKNSTSKADSKTSLSETTIYLYKSYPSKTNYLEKLTYELIKRRYPLEKTEDQLVYKTLKDSMIDQYFSECITKYLIPAINYYEENHHFQNTKLSPSQIDEIMKLYNYYQKYLTNNNLIKKQDLYNLINEDMKSKNYKYLILLGDISLVPTTNYLKIVNNYKESIFLKENIKLFYDYQKYLFDNQIIPIPHTYKDEKELNYLTITFLKENLNVINKQIAESNKIINIYTYDDQNRLLIYKNISLICENIISKLKDSSNLIGINTTKDINLLIGNSSFVRQDKNTIITKDKKIISYEKILSLKNNYNHILLPFLIEDQYHDNDLIKEIKTYQVKLMLYASLIKCNKELHLLCPFTKKDDLISLLGNIKKINIYE